MSEHREEEKLQKQDAVWRRTAQVMDNLFRVPGTNFRFGVDPILGLIPGVGDALSGLISSFLLLGAREARLPMIVQFRMALNIFLNTAIGAIPGFGDLFSLWFKSNVRNYELLQRYRGKGNAKTTDSWVFVVGLIGGTALAILGFFAMVFWMLSKLFGG